MSAFVAFFSASLGKNETGEFKLGWTYQDVFPLTKVDVLNENSWHTFMVLLVCVDDVPVSLATDTDDISWPITSLQFMTGKKENKFRS